MLSPNELLSFLVKNQILSSSQVEAVSKESQLFSSTVQLCTHLASRGWLTPYQQTQILSGQQERLLLGPYRILEPLGEGGMGLVFKAKQAKLDRLVALKIIRPQILASRPEILSRFNREARAIAQVNHPNIVILFDADEFEGTHYIAMEYVEGQTLETLVRAGGPMGFKQSCDYIRQAALGLQHAYEVGLVHRDIKPSNILVAQKNTEIGSSSIKLRRPALITIHQKEQSLANNLSSPTKLLGSWGQVKILDMGLARLTDGPEEDNAPRSDVTPLTRAGALLGTPDFIAPEQARDARKVDTRADIYSLGCTLYYLLTGRPPFAGGTDVQKLLRHVNEKPYPIEELRPGIPTALSQILNKMLEKKPEDRFQTPATLANALEAIIVGNSPVPSTEVVAETPPIADTPVPPSPAQVPEGARTVMSEIALSGESKESKTVIGPSLTPREQTTLGASEPIVPTVPLAPANSPNPKIQLQQTRTYGAIVAHSGMVGGLAISSDGRIVASAGIDSVVRVWEFNGSQPREMAQFPAKNTEFSAIGFSPNNDFLLLSGINRGATQLWAWDFNSNTLTDLGTFAANNGCSAMAFSPTQDRAAASIGPFIITWKVRGKSLGSRDTLKGHTQAIRCLAWSPDGKYLLSGGEGRQVRVWKWGWFGASVLHMITGHNDHVTCADFSIDGTKIATGSLDRSIVLWDSKAPSQGTAVPLFGHPDNIRRVKFLPDGKHLLSIGESGQVFLWDITTSLRVAEFRLSQSAATSTAITADGNFFASGSLDGKVTLFRLDTNPTTAGINKV